MRPAAQRRQVERIGFHKRSSMTIRKSTLNMNAQVVLLTPDEYRLAIGRCKRRFGDAGRPGDFEYLAAPNRTSLTSVLQLTWNPQAALSAYAWG
jgi:hypothetical protein